MRNIKQNAKSLKQDETGRVHRTIIAYADIAIATAVIICVCDAAS